MNVRTDIRSPNFTATVIPAEFVVLHYTAGSLERALSIFTDVERKVSCHLLIAEDGEIFELVECMSGKPLQAAHAGDSIWETEDKQWRSFNRFSIGIELVNRNGNLFEYSDDQYHSLAVVMKGLQKLYPALRSPHCVVGHEHIAPHRGKADPGRCFSWERFFEESYPDSALPARPPICPESLAKSLRKFLDVCPSDQAGCTKFWHALSAITETTLMLISEAKTYQ